MIGYGYLDLNIMSLKMIQWLELVFAILTVIGFDSHWMHRWEKWLAAFLFVGLDTWRCWRVGEISTGSGTRWYGFTFNRDDSPEFFTCVFLIQVLVTMVFFLLFLNSL